ncbi:MAG: potassium channel protein [Desulfarculaceae bacterium]|nr:potassium channel protein [Desulfarculaceae bacterium]
MDKLTRIWVAAAIAVLIFIGGTAGYMIIEDWSLVDSAYMTAITVSTVGFLEVHDVGTTGRIFTMVLIFVGVGYFLYLAGVIVQSIVEGELVTILGRRKLNKEIEKLENHYIICGYGRIGRMLCKLVKEETSNMVVIEKDEALVSVLEKDNMLYLNGDASSEETLRKAGIERAAYFVAALATDTANVFLVLTARQLNPMIYIMARAGSQDVKQKLMIAGANKVESPYDIGAASMGLKLLRPSVSSFLDIALSRKEEAIQIEESYVSTHSGFVNVALKDSGIRQKYNLIVIAVKKESGEMLFNPSFDTLLEAGDTVIAMGPPHNLNLFHKDLNP